MDRCYALYPNNAPGTFNIDIVERSYILIWFTKNTKGVDNDIMQEHENDFKPIRFVILGTPYTIKPTEELTVDQINELVEYVKSLVESYLRKGFDEQRVPLLVAFHIADEKRRLQEKFELPLSRMVERLQFAIEEDAPFETSDNTSD